MYCTAVRPSGGRWKSEEEKTCGISVGERLLVSFFVYIFSQNIYEGTYTLNALDHPHAPLRAG